MRLKRGSQVEVLSKKEVWIGAWIPSEIVSGNGRSYYVRFSSCPSMGGTSTEKVPRNVIRPCPPPVEGIGALVPGDIVEVFHNLSWKTAAIMEVMDEDQFSVKLMASSLYFTVHKHHLRARQIFEDGRWFVVRKGTRNCTISRREKSTQWITRFCRQTRVGFYQAEENNAFQSQMTLQKKVMTGLQVYSLKFDAHYGETLPGIPCTSGKTGAYKHLNETVTRNDAHRFFSGVRIRFPDAAFSRVDSSCHLKTSNDEDVGSNRSSVGSCGTDGNSRPFNSMTQQIRLNSGECSDSESFCGIMYSEEAMSTVGPSIQ